MAIRYYCDACGIEIERRLFNFNYLCHIENENKLNGYIDTEFHEPISSKTCKKDVCLSCYNKIFYNAYEVYKNIKNATV